MNSNKEYKEKKVELKNLPQIIAIYTTDECNLSCIACHFGQKTASKISISEEGYNKIYEIFPFVKLVGIAGAEMFFDKGNRKGYMNKTFKEAEKYKDIKFAGFTNGTLLSKEKINYIVDKFKWIGISIDSPEPRIYETIRVGSCLENIIKNIKVISNLKGKKGLKREDDPEIIISSVISERTYKSIYEMVELAYEVGAKAVHFQDPWKETYLNENIFIDINKSMEYIYLMKEAKAKAEKLGINILDRTKNTIIKNFPGIIESIEINQELIIESWPKCCDAPWNELYIWRNGDVKVCCTSKTVIGNINNESIGEIWNSKKIVSVRKKILNGIYSDCQLNCYKGYISSLFEIKPLSLKIRENLMDKEKIKELLFNKKRIIDILFGEYSILEFRRKRKIMDIIINNNQS